MDTFVNPVSFGDISVNVTDPFDVTIEAIKVSGTEIVSATRFEYPPVEGDAGVDVHDSVTISGQVLTVESLWTDIETRTKGVKRLQIVPKNTDNTAQEECNIFINVV